MMKNYKIKVLVVEDENLLLKNIQKKITAVSPDFQIIGEAYNGKETLEIIRNIPPDIVFTDIKMPIMDGLELARILYEDYPDISTVIVSGYDDFEYARTVLTYRVKDYLLKPVQPEQLKSILFSLRDTITDKKKADVCSALRRQLNAESLPPSTDKINGILDHADLSLFLFCLDNLKLRTQIQGHISDAGIYSDMWASRYDFSWDLLFKEADFTVSDFWIFPYDSENIFLLVTEGLSAAPESAAPLIFRNLQHRFPSSFINLVYDKHTAKFPHLQDSLQALQNRLISSLVIGKASLIGLQEAEPVLPPAILSKNSVSYFHTMTASNNNAGFKTALLQLFGEWKENTYPQIWVHKVLMQLLSLLQQDLYISDEDYEKMYRRVFEILEAQNDLISSGEKIAAELTHWISLTSAIPTDIEITIDELDTFIRLHYRENLSLTDLADKYHFNHSYLTRIFKKQKGQSPLKLINLLRIEDAKELLLNPELSVREISEMLGFSDQHYFSRSFKNFTGLSPNEYRNM